MRIRWIYNTPELTATIAFVSPPHPAAHKLSKTRSAFEDTHVRTMGPTHSPERDSSSPLYFLNPTLFAHQPCLLASSSSAAVAKLNPFASSPSSAPSAYAPVAPRRRASAEKEKKRRSASDVARLLDPSYLPSSAAKTRRSASVSAYVDNAGDMHDPDYRHFPLMQHHSQHAHNMHAHGVRRGTTSPRPHFDWELVLDESALDDEYPSTPPPAPRRVGPPSPVSPVSAYPYTASQVASISTAALQTRARDSSFSTATTYYSPTGTASTLPTSSESSPAREQIEKDDEESPFEDAEENSFRARLAAEMEKERALQRAAEEKEGGCKGYGERRRRRRMSREAEKEREKEREREKKTADEEEEEERQEVVAPHNDEEDEDGRMLRRAQSALEYVPTCTQSLRRQWQVLALRFRFGVFRARRRMARRVQSLL